MLGDFREKVFVFLVAFPLLPSLAPVAFPELILLGGYAFELMEHLRKTAGGVKASQLRDFRHTDPAFADQFLGVIDPNGVFVLGKGHPDGF